MKLKYLITSLLIITSCTAVEEKSAIPKIEAENSITEFVKSDVSTRKELHKNVAQLGENLATHQVLIFSDTQCIYCKKFFNEALLNLNPLIESKIINLNYLNFPIKNNKTSLRLAIAGKCALQQNKFWEFNALSYSTIEPKPQEIAETLGLDITTFNACTNSNDTLKIVENDYKLGLSLGVKGTPTFVINGNVIAGTENFLQYVKDNILNKIEQ